MTRDFSNFLLGTEKHPKAKKKEDILMSVTGSVN